MGWAVLVFDLYMLAMFVVEFTVNSRTKADLLKSQQVS